MTHSAHTDKYVFVTNFCSRWDDACTCKKHYSDSVLEWNVVRVSRSIAELIYAGSGKSPNYDMVRSYLFETTKIA